ncbi:hypothetical protein AAG570_011724 [Ranatra chinensis]|uniref:Uncharacterized protein n=1 Tax=Ranatra chinensis TaxID=642074 RepID=A0ABD0YGZ7_9HEMI
MEISKSVLKDFMNCRDVVPYGEGDQFSDSELNDHLDSMLESWRQGESNNEEGWMLSDLDCPFLKRIKFFGKRVVNTKGAFRAREGRIIGLLDLARTGDVVACVRGDQTALKCGLRLARAQVVYDRCTLHFLSIASEGSMKAVIVGTEVSFVVTVSSSEDVQLRRLQIENLGEVEFSFDGPGIVNSMMEVLANFLTKHFKRVIENILNRRLGKSLAKKMKRVRRMENLPPIEEEGSSSD